MTRKNNTQSNETPTIVLKTIINDVVRDVSRDRKIDIDVNAKRVRDMLRRRFVVATSHVHNSSWIFTTSQRDDIYDAIRVMHDAKYVETIARREKRNATSRKRNTRKRDMQTNDVANNVDDANNVEA